MGQVYQAGSRHYSRAANGFECLTLQAPMKGEQRATEHGAAHGKQVYAEKCAVRHGANGEGARNPAGGCTFPPVRGIASFNVGARIDAANQSSCIDISLARCTFDSLRDTGRGERI